MEQVEPHNSQLFYEMFLSNTKELPLIIKRESKEFLQHKDKFSKKTYKKLLKEITILSAAIEETSLFLLEIIKSGFAEKVVYQPSTPFECIDMSLLYMLGVLVLSLSGYDLKLCQVDYILYLKEMRNNLLFASSVIDQILEETKELS